jgi:hypothetical protein
MTVLFYSDMMILDSIHDLLSLTQLLGPNFPFPIYVPHRETQARGENAELTKGAEESELRLYMALIGNPWKHWIC